MPANVSSTPIAERDDALPTLEGRAWNLGLALDAGQIVEPASGCGDDRQRLFAAVDPDLGRCLAANDVIIAEAMDGDADHARGAAAALAAAGVRVLVAASFGVAFRAACRQHAVVTVVVDTPSCLHTHDRLRLDFDAEKIVNLSSGDRVPMRNLDEQERSILRTSPAAARRR